jgi:dihydrofolate reductase
VRKVILMISVSLDGFFEGPDGDLGWHLVDDEVHTHFNEALEAMSAFIEGRRTYELMESFWAAAGDDPEITGPMAEFAGIWRDTPKIVYSRTLKSVGDNATLVRAVVPEEVEALKSGTGGDMTIGGPDLARAFMERDLIDEYRIYVHPVILGRGRSLFPASDRPVGLRLIEARAFDNGVVLLRYERHASDT